MNYVHGGDVYRRAVDLDYSVNINPLGMPPRACAAAKHGVDQSIAYPDWKVEKLRDAVVSFLNRKLGAVAPEWITFGNGAADLIYRLMQVLRPQEVIVAAPAFAEYSVAAERVGAQLRPIYLAEADDFSFTPAVEAAFIHAIEGAPSGSAVFLCNPNNPDGNVICAEVLRRIAAVCESKNSWLIVDECFLPFLRSDETSHTVSGCLADTSCAQEDGEHGTQTAVCPSEACDVVHERYPSERTCSMVPSLQAFQHLVILRAFTKIYGMPGLRLGYMLTAAQALTDAVQATMTPWEINLPAQLAGVAALEETEFVEKTRALIREERAFLVRVLPTLPYVEKVYVSASDANFILFRTALEPHRVDLKERLLEKGILIRACGNYEGLDARYYRICVRTHEENLKLMHRWRTLKTPDVSGMTNSEHSAHRARAIMVQGTMSNAGKSLLVAGLCRIFHEDGYRVAPFKAQNMALNSFITDEGLEMGRAQVVQAEAAGIAPDARMNPILLKPTTDVGSQVIVRGVAQGNMTARAYYRSKKALLPVVRDTYASLAAEYDIIVIEGAGSPAEVNLREDDLVNMGMAAIADAPVLLVGDIDRGGVFAQLLGTIELLEPEERARIRGLIINKFRGDKTILDPGLDILEARTGKAVLGVVPYLDVALEDEDSLSTALEQRQAEGGLDIAVIRLPRISNFTDFTALATEPGVSVRYVSSVRELGEPDVLILPGTKSTIRDLDWLRSTGLEAKILQKQARGTLILGICGGFQMLGTEVVDVEGVEGPVGARTRGLGLLPLRTEFEAEKTRTQTSLVLEGLTDEFAALNGQRVDGYEIHMGRTNNHIYYQEGNVFGTYLHGFFDRDGLRNAFVERLCRRKGIDPGDREVVNYEAFKEAQFAKLSAALRASLDMARIYEILEGGQA